MTHSDSRRRLEQQLSELVTVERQRLLASIAAVDGKDPADQAERAVREFDLAQLEARIRRLADRIAALDDRPAGMPGGALPRGAVLILDFGDGPEAYRFSHLDIDDGLDVVTPDSPLGRALATASVGDAVTYRGPRGEVTVTLVSLDVPAAA